MAEQSLAPLAVDGGGRAVAGGLVGYGAKKVVKILALIAGAFLAAIAYLESEGIIEGVDWSALTSTINDAIATLNTAEVPAGMVASNGLFAAGFLAGFKKG